MPSASKPRGRPDNRARRVEALRAAASQTLRHSCAPLSSARGATPPTIKTTRCVLRERWAAMRQEMTLAKHVIRALKSMGVREILAAPDGFVWSMRTRRGVPIQDRRLASASSGSSLSHRWAATLIWCSSFWRSMSGSCTVGHSQPVFTERTFCELFALRQTSGFQSD